VKAAPAGVLLLHGVGGGAAIWGAGAVGTVQRLQSAGYAAWALDFPGYGVRQSEPPPDLPALVAAVQAAADAARAQGVTRLAAVGHSMGGMVLQEWLARGAPPTVQAAVLMCTTAAFGPPGGDWQARFLAERLAPLDAGQGMAAVARQLVPGLVWPLAPVAALHAAERVMAAVPEATYRAALAAIAAFDRREALARIAVPTLLLAAEHDRTAPPALMQRMAERVPGSRYACLAAAGHIANVEQPEAFHHELLAFLSDTLPL
jgi:3-oxoadipate enol-lactonase